MSAFVRKISLLLGTTFCLLWLVSVPKTMAQDTRLQPAGLTFNINSEFSYDDNVLRQGDASVLTNGQPNAQPGELQQAPRIGSRLVQLNPQLSYLIRTGTSSYTVNYAMDRSEYLESKQDNMTNHSLQLSTEQRFNRFNKLTVQGALNYAHEARGVGFNEGLNALNLDEPTLFATHDLFTRYQLGQDGKSLRLIAEAGWSGTDRDSSQITNDSRDYRGNRFGATLQYRVGSRTDLLVEYRNNRITYPRTPTTSSGVQTPLDSVSEEYLAGVNLEATSKTTGRLRVGTSKRSFKWKAANWSDRTALGSTETAPAPSPSVVFASDSAETLFWEFAAVWAPRTYSRFELSTRTYNREALGVGSFIRSEDYTLMWTHQWNNRVRSRLEFTTGKDDYVDANRQDERKSYQARFEYDFTKVFNVGIGIRYTETVSNFSTSSYDKSVYYLFANYHNR